MRVGCGLLCCVVVRLVCFGLLLLLCHCADGSACSRSLRTAHFAVSVHRLEQVSQGCLCRVGAIILVGAASVGGLVAPLVTSLSHSHTLTAVTDVSKDAAATKLQACYRGSRVRFTVLVLLMTQEQSSIQCDSLFPPPSCHRLEQH